MTKRHKIELTDKERDAVIGALDLALQEWGEMATDDHSAPGGGYFGAQCRTAARTLRKVVKS